MVHGLIGDFQLLPKLFDVVLVGFDLLLLLLELFFQRLQTTFGQLPARLNAVVAVGLGNGIGQLRRFIFVIADKR